ncbi:uncharacterized protein K441DRAFT_720125 [Cenococcum geophilum 1.58]|uniref:uncharacterized protein n=1 Tax=Cenococcum geophilum 1.58 TaxID=794803 RepID=UPI00358FC1C9|nr:hypothetical protein K441DRAFT_720125 [Cenococcum geophilum 1.58]
MSEEHLSKFVALPPPNWSNIEEAVSFLVQHAELCASSSHGFDEAIETTRASRVFGRSTKLSSMFNHSAIAHTRWTRERLGEITVPTLVIHEDEDCVIPYPHGVALSKEVPNAELLTMEQTGHEIPRRFGTLLFLQLSVIRKVGDFFTVQKGQKAVSPQFQIASWLVFIYRLSVSNPFPRYPHPPGGQTLANA